MGVLSAAAVIAVTHDPYAIAAAGLAGAALAGAIRALSGDAPASLVAAMLAPLLVLASLAEHELVTVTSCLSVAAIAWTVVELSRASTSPLVAMLPATIAGVLEPAAIALVPIAGARLVTAPWNRPRWAIAIPIAGGLAVMLAMITYNASDGSLGALGARWFGPAHATTPPALAVDLAEALGPLTAVAAIAGLALIAKLRLAELAIVACALGALLVDLRAGTTGPTTLGIAGLAAALAIGRFALTIRMPPLQAVAGATVAMMLLLPSAWTVISR